MYAGYFLQRDAKRAISIDLSRSIRRVLRWLAAEDLAPRELNDALAPRLSSWLKMAKRKKAHRPLRWLLRWGEKEEEQRREIETRAPVSWYAVEFSFLSDQSPVLQEIHIPPYRNEQSELEAAEERRRLWEKTNLVCGREKGKEKKRNRWRG